MAKQIDDELGSNLDDKPSMKPKGVASVAAPQGEKKIAIIIEDNDKIPPTGLFVGVNGRNFMIRPGEVVRVPQSVIDVLNHAVESVPDIDPLTRRPMKYRDRMKYPYRRVYDQDDPRFEPSSDRAA